MSKLSENIERLFGWLESIGLNPPKLEVLIAEFGPGAETDERGRLRVTEKMFHSPKDYEKRFEELSSGELPWINLGCYGVLKSHLIVGVEYPARRRSDGPTRKFTSVNYFGPPSSVLQNDWDATEALALQSF